MKNAIFSISVFFFIGIAHAQFYPDWTEPVAITDSLSINSNPVVLTTTDDQNNDVFCFYEKRATGGSPSRIWYRNIYTMSDEQIVFNEDVFEFRNPNILVYPPYYDSRYFLVYESNQTGDFDLYGIEFFTDGTFGQPFNLTNTPGDESSCDLGGGYEFNEACWKYEESILTSHISVIGDSLQFEEVYTIDTTNCFDPVCTQNYVLYRKITNDSSHIYYSKFNEAENLWTEPDTVYATGNNINLAIAKYNSYLYNDWVTAVWENNRQLLSWEGSYQEISHGEFEGISECVEPDFLTFDIYVDYFDFPAVFTFYSGEGQNKEVYSYADYAFYGQNLSNNNVVDSNPKVFYGPFYSNYFNTIDIWQTHINGNSVLYMSQISILLGSIGDHKRNDVQFLRISPNPFNEMLNIEYYISGNNEVSIDIYTISGKQIDHINIYDQKTGWNTYTWKVLENGKNNLPEGIYFIVLKQGNETVSKKTIYSK